MAAISQKQENCSRLDLLLKGPAQSAVRKIFDEHFPTERLTSILKQQKSNLRLKGKIEDNQWKIMFPSDGDAVSKDFDTSLMCALIKMFKPQTDAADLNTILNYRNKLAHHSSDEIDNWYFNQAFIDISGAVKRLAGESLYQECQDLKTKILDHKCSEPTVDLGRYRNKSSGSAFKGIQNTTGKNSLMLGPSGVSPEFHQQNLDQDTDKNNWKVPSNSKTCNPFDEQEFEEDSNRDRPTSLDQSVSNTVLGNTFSGEATTAETSEKSSGKKKTKWKIIEHFGMS